MGSLRWANLLDPFFVPLAVATLALFWVVPAFPLLHLDDPGHWGVIGYLVCLAVILRLRLRVTRDSRSERWLFAVFLAAMPVVYLADWFRFDGRQPWLWIELAGALPFWLLAALGLKRSPWYLVAGIAGHALWDGWHYLPRQYTLRQNGPMDFVADWYALGCLIIDAAVAIYLWGQVSLWQGSGSKLSARR